MNLTRVHKILDKDSSSTIHNFTTKNGHIKSEAQYKFSQQSYFYSGRLSAPRPTAELEDVPPSATRGRTKLL
jgi:hypothetical protein